MKKAVLVRCSFVARVIVNDTDTPQRAIDKARSSFMIDIINNLEEASEEIVEDEELPFGSLSTDK